MIRRLLVTTAVLAAALYWADCDFDPAPATVYWNRYFEGCFTGTTPAGTLLTLVLDAPDGNEDAETLTGCLQHAMTLATATGDVDDALREQASLFVTPTGGRPPFSLRVTRDPAGQMNAATIDLADAGGAPPSLASVNDLARCTMTCQDLGIGMPFAPETP